MRIESADGNGNAGGKAELFSPLNRKPACDGVRRQIATFQFAADAGEERIDLHQKIFRRQTAEAGVPHPFVTHGADATLRRVWVENAAKGSGDHVTVFECGSKSGAFTRVVTQPVQQFGEAPLGRVDAAAPLDGGKLFAMRGFSDFGGF